MITTVLELQRGGRIAETLQEVKKHGMIERFDARNDCWTIGVTFPDYRAAAELFGSFYQQPLRLNVLWMLKGQDPFNEQEPDSRLVVDRPDALGCSKLRGGTCLLTALL